MPLNLIDLTNQNVRKTSIKNSIINLTKSRELKLFSYKLKFWRLKKLVLFPKNSKDLNIFFFN